MPGLQEQCYEVSDIMCEPTLTILSHIWQEFHRDAPLAAYIGPTNDDRKVVENHIGADGVSMTPQPQPKQRLHLCFQEKAIATIDVKVRGDYYACWQIIDTNGNIVKEHPQFSAANYENNAAGARLQTGKYGWLWDGRNNAANPVFVALGAYRSRIIIKGGVGAEVAGGRIEHQSHASVDAQGNPYRIFIVGQPKTDAELRAEVARPALGNRFLHADGERIARDCWIKVYRGEENDGHIVFLGQGTIEAAGAEGAPRHGAIATPHAPRTQQPPREFKGWIRPRPDGDRVQVEDVGRINGTIQLTNPTPGGPPPNNPYCTDHPNTPAKDYVQAHVGSATEWTFDGLSVGCTTVKRIAGTVANPGSVLGNVRSKDSSFGGWATGAGQNVAQAGRDFKNKQTNLRNRIEDALIADDHGAPELNPPQHPAPAAGAPLPVEPLHMQPTMQQGVWGGFLGHEIPQGAVPIPIVADDPINMLRIRMRLEDYANGSMYYQYHHAVVFGHTWEQVQPNRFRITVYIPRKVIREWNGNRRNLLVRGNCQTAWYILRRLIGGQVGPPQIVHRLGPPGALAGNYAALPNNWIGRRQETWTYAAPLAPGEYVSVFRYKVELKPYVAGNDIWVAEAAATDLFSGVGQPASIAAERIVIDGNRQYIEGESELVITTVPP